MIDILVATILFFIFTKIYVLKKQSKIRPSIVLIGSGNVGTQLGKRLYKKGQNIVQVFSRKAEKAEKLAKAIHSEYTNDLSQIKPKADLYILAVHDDYIGSIAKSLSGIISTKSFITHTSGSTPSTVIKPYFKRFGVFYPLQTFNIGKKPAWSKIPICLHSSKNSDLKLLKKIADSISQKVYFLTDEQRGVAHVAAVFANNFSNHVFTIAQQILYEENLPFDLVRPLILETAEKIRNANPSEMQTGPAVRGDDATIQRHLKYLKKDEKLKEIYTIMTEHIKVV